MVRFAPEYVVLFLHSSNFGIRNTTRLLCLTVFFRCYSVCASLMYSLMRSQELWKASCSLGVRCNVRISSMPFLPMMAGTDAKTFCSPYSPSSLQDRGNTFCSLWK